MREKLKHKFIFLLVIVLIATLFFSTSCEVVSIMLGYDTDTIEKRKNESYKELVEQEKKDTELKRKREEEQLIAETELEEGFEGGKSLSLMNQLPTLVSPIKH